MFLIAERFANGLYDGLPVHTVIVGGLSENCKSAKIKWRECLTNRNRRSTIRLSAGPLPVILEGQIQMQDSEHQPSDVHSLESSSKPAAALGQSTLEVLKAGRARIADPARWCKQEYFRGDACCSWGALRAVNDGNDQGEPEEALSAQMGGSVGEFNDTHSHAEVLAAWDRAIEADQTTAQPDVQGDAK